MQVSAERNGDLSAAQLRLDSISVERITADRFLVDVGTPHLVCLDHDLDQDVSFRTARAAGDGPNAVNVTWVAPVDGDVMRVPAFERGVGAKRDPCGTGSHRRLPRLPVRQFHKTGRCTASISIGTNAPRQL